MAGALDVSVAVMRTAGEGGPWGMALLAAYRAEKQAGVSLEDFLEKRVFADSECSVLAPDPQDTRGFAAFMRDYMSCIPVEKAAVAALK